MEPSLLEALRVAARVTILTGAGVSAESGVPTFRDRQIGLWERFDAAELATPQAYARDPALVWGWYEWRRAAVLRAQPNLAHRSIAALASKMPAVTLITQNVDDLHERAGSSGLLHLHGRLMRPYCQQCGQPYALCGDVPEIPEGGQRIDPPRCATCGGRVRPGVVWFGEPLPAEEWRSAVLAAQRCDAFFAIGTSAVVQPAASLIGLARRAGAVTVQINPDATAADGVVDYHLQGKAGVILPALLHAWHEILIS